MLLQYFGENVKMPTMKEKLAEVDQFLQALAAESRLSENEVAFIKATMDEQSALIDVLKEENIKMKENWPQLQPLHNEFNCCEQASDTILSLNLKLNDMRLKVLDLEKKLTQFGIDVVLIESAKSNELIDLNHQWQDKLRHTNCQSRKIIQEIVKKHCEAKKGYETVIHGLKEQIAHKEAEVAWCQLILKERDNNVDKELINLKKELEMTTMKNQELLQQRLAEVERRANKMTRKCLKLQQNYEQKITVLKKEKDLQVQALQNYVRNEAERDTNVRENKVEAALKELEMRYRKIIINLHTAAQLQRQKDMKRIAALESAQLEVTGQVAIDI